VGRPQDPQAPGDVLSTLEFTDWATDILRRSHEAARRFNPDATVRVFRAGSGVRFELTDRAEPGDRTLDDHGFVLYVEDGIEGLVDVVEPHDQLVLRPLGSTPNPREH
jgi:hypothetical protein